MPQYTLEVAQAHLNAWLAAELALSTSQSYTINGRSITRANIAEVMQQIRYWRKQLNIASGLRSQSRLRRYVPTDL